jgi:hypothetical protein
MPLVLVFAFAQDPTPPAGGRGRGPGGGAGAPAAQTAHPRPYAEVVTKDAVTQSGLFKVHQVEDRVLFEIPKAVYGRVLTWKATTAGGTAEADFAGEVSGVTEIRFARRGNRVYMISVDYGLRTDGPEDAGYRTNVETNTVETIVGSYPVAAEAPDGAAVIDVSAMFLGNPGEIASRRTGGGGATVDAARSYIEKVKAFPTNIEVTSTETITPAAGAPGGGRFGLGASGTTTKKVHYSLVELPETPMMGRYSDVRIGFFHTDFSTIGSPNNRVESKGFITRYRLEKKDPSAALSEPVKPITWYVSKEVPKKWRMYVKRGIESWNIAFEKAGFKHAIVALDPPDDPDWNPEDARYSVVRWSPRAVQNAYAGPMTDPRSGETICAQMVIFQDVMKLAQGWYFAQCGAIDPRASKLPVDDDLQGRLLSYVVAHECGHALGLYHNWKASSHYSIAQLRDPAFTAKYGVSASIMDYSRFNYVAQPSDKVTNTIQSIGTYDQYAISWGYTPIAGVTKPEQEEKTLDGWLARQIKEPELRYWPEGDPVDPAAQNEDISDDAIAAGRLGMRNIDRITNSLLLASTSKFGKPYDLLAEMHQYLASQRQQETVHVLKNVGGVEGNDFHAGRGTVVYSAVPKAKQAACVHFLINEALRPSTALNNPAILNRIENSGVTSDFTRIQASVLNQLFGEARLQRLTDYEVLAGSNAYTVANLVSDVTSDAWSELGAAHPDVDIVRRSLQRSYLQVMDTKVNPTAPSQTDVKMLALATLKGLAHRIDVALGKTSDVATQMHLQSCRRDIERIIDGKYAPLVVETGAAPAAIPGRRPAMDCSVFSEPMFPLFGGDGSK